MYVIIMYPFLLGKCLPVECNDLPEVKMTRSRFNERILNSLIFYSIAAFYFGILLCIS